ncbi:hypothetical protein BDW75DRAFT_234191 [Aspergillus navahoensis]
MVSQANFSGDNSGFQLGVNYGPVTAQFPPPEQPETPPSPLSTVPFRRDPDFIDRPILLDQLDEKCSAPASRVALVGLGGVGKSQLVIEYCYRVRDRSPDSWVFWIQASNAARFEQSCREIADRLRIRGRQDPKANIFVLVFEWLRDEQKGQWVLVLDNVDDGGFLHEAPARSHDTTGNGPDNVPGQPLLAYLPPNPNGTIIITSRSRKVATTIVEDTEVIAVEPMDSVEAQALFRKKLGMAADAGEVAELTAALEYMPLAVVQAASYIRQRAPFLSVARYLQEFRGSDKEKRRLLDAEGGHLRRDREAKSSIINTWQISFSHVQQTRRSAADLLSLMSFFDRQGIPGELLRTHRTMGNCNGNGGDDGDDDSNKGGSDDNGDVPSRSGIDGYVDDVMMLRDYSFISIDTDGEMLQMHRLVQLAMQDWLGNHRQLEKWKEIFIKELRVAFPTGEYGNWKQCQALFPHVQSALGQRPDRKASLEEWASLMNNAAHYVLLKGNFRDAEQLATQAVDARMELVLGEDHPDTLTSMSNLAFTFWSQGRWKEAEELWLQVVEIWKRVLGEDHPDTLTCMSRWKAAEELGLQVMVTRKRVLGEDHPDTLTSMGILALTYNSQGRWKEAEELGLQVMEARKRVLGEDHPETLISMGNLALTYNRQGRRKEAEELGLQVMETRKRVLGEVHLDTLTSGRWKEAEELGLQAMETRKRVLGEDHPDTLTSMANLASTYTRQGRLKEAEELGLQVMEACKRVLGEDHPDTLTSMSDLALTYNRQGRWKEAEELGLQVMETRKRVLGQDHPDTLTSMGDLASIYRSQGRWKEAEELGLQVMEARNKVLGENHPDTIASMHDLSHFPAGEKAVEKLFQPTTPL